KTELRYRLDPRYTRYPVHNVLDRERNLLLDLLRRQTLRLGIYLYLDRCYVREGIYVQVVEGENAPGDDDQRHCRDYQPLAIEIRYKIIGHDRPRNRYWLPPLLCSINR